VTEQLEFDKHMNDPPRKPKLDFLRKRMKVRKTTRKGG